MKVIIAMNKLGNYTRLIKTLPQYQCILLSISTYLPHHYHKPPSHVQIKGNESRAVLIIIIPSTPHLLSATLIYLCTLCSLLLASRDWSLIKKQDLSLSWKPQWYQLYQYQSKIGPNSKMPSKHGSHRAQTVTSATRSLH